jgi:energy-converting hydrogenase Eha subunit H
MKQDIKIRMISGVCTVFLALATTFFLESNSSPFYSYNIDTLRNIWANFQIIPYLMAIILSGKFHGFSPPIYWVVST